MTVLHRARVATTISHEMRGRLRRFLRIRPRRKIAPVLSGPIETTIERHACILDSILKHAPAHLQLRGKAVCEVGAGDCLASASLFLAQGADRVDIVEVNPCIVDDRQVRVLEGLRDKGLPIDLSIVRKAASLTLDETRVFYHRCFMEDFRSDVQYEFLFSFSVVEHVEDLAGFYKSCWDALASGGWMLHMIDLGGHGQFEDPLPPLDFQTYPDWLYGLMYPKYHRATRRFLHQHTAAVTSAGFRITALTPTRVVDDAYLNALRPKLRPAACERSNEELRVIEFALAAQKPPL
jgi:hypothetical protein